MWPSGIDPRVRSDKGRHCNVDDDVHAPDSVHLLGNASRFHGATEIADDDSCGSRSDICKVGGTFCGACVENHLVAFGHESACRGEAEPICRSTDEDATHIASLVELRSARATAEEHNARPPLVRPFSRSRRENGWASVSIRGVIVWRFSI